MISPCLVDGPRSDPEDGKSKLIYKNIVSRHSGSKQINILLIPGAAPTLAYRMKITCPNVRAFSPPLSSP